MNITYANARMRAALLVAGFTLVKTKADMGLFSAQGVEFAWQYDLAPNGIDVRAATLWCSMGTLPEIPDKALAERLLALNLFGGETHGGHVGFYRPTRALIYAYRMPWEEGETEENAATELVAAVLTVFTQTAIGLKEAFDGQLNALPASGASIADIPLFGSAPVIWG